MIKKIKKSSAKTFRQLIEGSPYNNFGKLMVTVINHLPHNNSELYLGETFLKTILRTTPNKQLNPVLVGGR